MRTIKYILFLLSLMGSYASADVMVNGQIAGLDSTNIKDGSLSVPDIANGGNGFLPKTSFGDTLANRHPSSKVDSLLFDDGSTSFRSDESEIIATPDTVQTMGLKLKALASNTNSPPMRFLSNTTGTLKSGSIYGAYGADPYLVFAAPNDAGVEVPVFHLHDTSIAFVTDNSVDIGGASDNRPKDIHISGTFNAGGAKTWWDSSYAASNAGAMGDIAGLNDRLGEKIDKTALDDSLEAKGVYPDSMNTGSLAVTGYAQFRTTPTVPAFLWEVKSTEFYTYAADSAAVSDLMDTTGVNTMQWFYKRIAGNASPSQKITILLASQIPSSVTPDSLIVKLRSNAATADSASIQFIVKDSDGTALLTSAITVVSAVNTWEYTSFGGINPMTENRVCAYEMIIRTQYDATLDVSSMYFK